MTTAIYLAAADARAGRSLLALGLLEALARRSDRVGYFRPVILGEDDRRTALARSRSDLGDRIGHAWTDAEVDDLLSTGRREELFRGVISAYRELAERCDVVLIEGTDTTGARAALEFEFNARVATHLGAWMVAMVKGGDRAASDVVESVQVTTRALHAEGVSIAAVVANRVRPDEVAAVVAALADSEVMTAVVPEAEELGTPSLGEIVDAIGATPVRDDGEPAAGRVYDVPVTEVGVAAMSLSNLLARLRDGELIITPGDRSDVLVGVVASRVADTYPDVAGVLLTGGFTPPKEILSLADGMGGGTLPLYSVADDTYECARRVAAVQPAIRPGDERKIAAALGLFSHHVDAEALLGRIEVPASNRTTPLMFEYELIERARADRRHIVLPEGIDERILRASLLLRRRDVVDLTLLGSERDVRRAASAAGVALPDDVAITNPADDDRLEDFADAFVDARSHKGMVKDRALEVMTDVSYFGTMMVHLGHADGMVSGAAHTTAHTIRPAFQFVGPRPGVDSVSSVFLMCLEDRVLVYGDCAIIPNPTADQLADIAVSSAETARTFGIDPVVAMLSYSSGGSGSGEDVDRVRQATELVRTRAPDLAVEGPIQYDAAVDVGVGRKKLPESEVAGRATVFVFPDLNTGNNTYKAVQRSAGAVAIGPVLQGLVKPVNDLSRGCTVNDILNTVAITAIQAQVADTRGDDG